MIFPYFGCFIRRSISTRSVFGRGSRATTPTSIFLIAQHPSNLRKFSLALNREHPCDVSSQLLHIAWYIVSLSRSLHSQTKQRLLSFSQFMLQWYGNMPEETVFYSYRMFGGWQIVSIIVLVGHWAFPYVSLVTRWSKRILPILAFLAAWQLVFHYIDLYWNVMPNQTWETAGGWIRGPLQGDPELHKVNFHFMDVTLLLGLIGLWLAAVGKSMKGNLVPVNDPKLGECLAFENY